VEKKELCLILVLALSIQFGQHILHRIGRAEDYLQQFSRWLIERQFGQACSGLKAVPSGKSR
jgi:hypothetical protein